MRKYLVLILTAVLLYSFPANATNWTFTDNVTIQGNLTVEGTTTVSAGTYQAYDADLAVLSFPTAWRQFISNGSQAITEVAFGSAGTCWKSNGTSSAPTWGTCGSGVGSLDNTTMDNTVIGGTTPVAGSFSSLTRGSVTDDEFGYLDNVTSGIQTQLNAKQALDNGTFTGEVTGTQFNSTGLDNTHYINVANNGAPNSGSETAGDCYYDNTTKAWLCWDGNSWEGPAFVAISHGASPTIDGEGEAGVDTTADQLVYYGGAERVLTYQYTKDFVIYAYSASHDNVVKWKADTNQTLTQLDCITGGADNVTVTLYECDSGAANCATTGLVAAATSAGASDSTASNGSIDVDDWIKVNLTTLQGTATSVACTVRYVITRQ